MPEVILHQKLEGWQFGVVGCPNCKHSLYSYDHTLHCEECSADFKIADGIPSLLKLSLVTALNQKTETIKSYYQNERYDWTTNPKGLEFIYHRFRRWSASRQISKIIRPGDVVLDAGCGTGLITKEISKYTHKVIAIDMNRWALAKIKNNLNVTTLEGDVEALPVKDDSVDLVIMTEVLEHLIGTRETLEELYRVCRHRGAVIGSVPSKHILWRLRKRLSLSCSGNEPFHRCYSKQEITSLLTKTGFKVAVKLSNFGLNWLWILEKP